MNAIPPKPGPAIFSCARKRKKPQKMKKKTSGTRKVNEKRNHMSWKIKSPAEKYQLHLDIFHPETKDAPRKEPQWPGPEAKAAPSKIRRCRGTFCSPVELRCITSDNIGYWKIDNMAPIWPLSTQNGRLPVHLWAGLCESSYGGVGVGGELN